MRRGERIYWTLVGVLLGLLFAIAIAGATFLTAPANGGFPTLACLARTGSAGDCPDT